MRTDGGPRAARRRRPVLAVAVSGAALAIAAVAALLRGHAGGFLESATGGPTLPSISRPFPAAAVDGLAPQLAAQKAVADRLFAVWQNGHPTADDAAFVAFVIAHTPAPPGPATQTQELDELRRLAATRTPDLITTADQLEKDGKQQIWSTAGQAAARRQPGLDASTIKAELKETQSLADAISHAAKSRFSRDSPYITDPRLRPDKKVQPGSHNPCYPSTHAIDSYSQATVLAHLDPADADQLQAIAGQVAYSRLYMAGHYRSDLVTGAMLGYLIADYVQTQRLP